MVNYSLVVSKIVWGYELRELPSLAKDIRIQGLEMPQKCKPKDIFMRSERVEVHWACALAALMQDYFYDPPSEKRSGT